MYGTIGINKIRQEKDKFVDLAQKMWDEPTKYCEGWNFGPKMDTVVPVWDVAMMLINHYGQGKLLDYSDKNAVHEANLLMLDINKAKNRLTWSPLMTTDECIALTVDWYKRYCMENVYLLCVEEINKFLKLIKK